MERYQIMASNLYQVLRTPVSEKILKLLNDKEMALLQVKINSFKYYTGELDQDELKEVKDIKEMIMSILQNGKNRLPNTKSDSAKQFIKIKYNK